MPAWDLLIPHLGTRLVVMVCLMSALLVGHGRSAQEPGIEVRYLAPDIPTPPAIVEGMLQLAQVVPEDVVFDLGCGDGRIVVEAAADFGARAVGVDIDLRQVEKARTRAHEAGVPDRVTILHRDLLSVDLSEATVVTLYLGKKVNNLVRPMLEAGLDPGDRVVSHDFEIEGWHFSKRLTLRDHNNMEHNVYLWVIGQHRTPPRPVDLRD